MHVVQSAVRIAIASRPFVTLTYRGRICWVSLKLITRVISLVSSLLGATISAIVEWKHPENSGGIGWGRLSQQKTCNISETGQDKTNVTLVANRKLHTRFRLVQKSTTSDDLERPFHTPFQNTRVFKAYHENLREDRPILSVA